MESIENSGILEETYKSLSTDNIPISLDDLYMQDREQRYAAMASQFAEMDKLSGEPSSEDLRRLDAMEQFDNFDKLDAMSKDLENNDKCEY